MSDKRNEHSSVSNFAWNVQLVSLVSYIHTLEEACRFLSKNQKKKSNYDMDSVAPVHVMSEGDNKLALTHHIQHILNMNREDYDPNNHVDYYPFSMNGKRIDCRLNSNTKKNDMSEDLLTAMNGRGYTNIVPEQHYELYALYRPKRSGKFQ
jgi:hypothetical protein